MRAVCGDARVAFKEDRVDETISVIHVVPDPDQPRAAAIYSRGIKVLALMLSESDDAGIFAQSCGESRIHCALIEPTRDAAVPTARPRRVKPPAPRANTC